MKEHRWNKKRGTTSKNGEIIHPNVFCTNKNTYKNIHECCECEHFKKCKDRIENDLKYGK